MKRFLPTLALSLLGLAISAGSAHAQGVTSDTFADWSQVGNAKPFQFTNNGLTSAATKAVVGSATDAPVNFTFKSSPFLVAAGLVNTTVGNVSLTWNTRSNINATATPIPGFAQPLLTQGFNNTGGSQYGVMTLVYNGPNTTIGGVNFVTGDELLRVSFSSGALSGFRAGASPGFTSSLPGDTVTFSANMKYFNFAGAVSQNYGISFTGLDTTDLSEPPVGVSGFQINSSNSLIRSFRADGTGSFAAGIIPEPASLAMVGLGLIGLPTAIAIRRRRAAR